MPSFHFDTTWHLEASTDKVFDALTDSLHWPDWWPGLAHYLRRVFEPAERAASSVPPRLR